MSEMTHDRCSELLPDLLAGGLSADEALEVEQHLEGCADCRSEMKAVSALSGDLTPLTDFERVSLRRAVKTTLPEEQSFGPAERGFFSKAAPFLSAAAALLILGFAITSIDLGANDEMGGATAGDAGGSDDNTDSGASAGRAAEGSDAAGDTVAEYDDEVAALESNEAEGQSGGSTAGGGENAEITSDAGAALPAEGRDFPVFRTEQRLSRQGLKAQTERRAPYRSAARSLDPANNEADRERLIGTLARRAERNGRSGDALTTCIRSIPSLRTRPVPVLALYGTLGGDESLAVGYVGGGSTSYNRFLIAIWTPPSECTSPSLIRGHLR